MYRIIGADQKEYGPVSTEQVREWITQRRADGRTRIKPEGAADWRTLADLPEFADALNGPALAKPGDIPPPVTPSVLQPRTSGMAIASLVLGILGLISCGITALVGLVLGILAFRKIDKNPQRLTGKGLAIAGISVSGALLLLIPIQIGMLLPALAKAKSKAQQIRCMTNLKQVGLAATMYASDNNDQLPPAKGWTAAISKYLPDQKVLICSADTLRGGPGYFAYNANLSGIKATQLTSPMATVLFFESEAGPDAAGGREKALRTPRHGNAVNVVFCDGHAEMVPVARLDQLKWTP